ncbi:MAG TPA: hypothetical protein GXX75_10975 [Clostridiales bacterium]|nr:hypothetical protein [Clostridiales bacterium]
MAREKKVYPNNFATKFGAGSMAMMNVAGAALMTSTFMLYLTDYAGLGAWGASLATVVLLIGRIVDAVNDPLQGMIMDRAKTTKFGKYRRFCLNSTIITALSIIILFNLPKSFTGSPVLVTIWVLVFYLAYDFGTSFFANIALIQTVSDSDVVRSSLLTWARVVGTVIAVPMSFFISSVMAVNAGVNDLHKSFGITTIIWILPIAIISILGTLLIKEGKSSVKEQDDSKISFKDFFRMIKQNKPLQVVLSAALFVGFVWTLLFATGSYYIKWAYCADFVTGEVDNAKYGMLAGMMGLMQLIPILGAAMLSPFLIKKLGSAIKVLKVSLVITSVMCLVMYILQLVGLLQTNITIYVIVQFLIQFGVGLLNIPAMSLSMEAMDYNLYISGDSKSGMVAAATRLLEKLQGALSASLIGFVLVIVGYSVDSKTGAFLGDLSAIPGMLNNFMLVSGLVPAVLCFIAILIYRKYPITNEVRAEMKAAIAAKKSTIKG